jgi:mannose-6-phosphate isomerase-like protein (cupin superfamily)
MAKEYKDIILESGLIRRTIKPDVGGDECTWHRDARDRTVLVKEGRGWMFQTDDSLPTPIKAGTRLQIPAGSWHRVIPGDSPLVMLIKETKETDPRSDSDSGKGMLIDLIRELSLDEEPGHIDLQGDEPAGDFAEYGIEDDEKDLVMNEADLLHALVMLEAKKSSHEPGYKAPEGSARDRKLDAAKAAYKRGDVQAAIRIRDDMEQKAREKPGYETRKSKYTDETRQPADYPPVMSELDELESYDEDDMCEGLSGKTREALKKKAKNSNAPLGALATVYRKGLGAFYSSGSRPGMTSHQWAMARVNSFLRGGKARKVDAAQWKQVQKHRKN